MLALGTVSTADLHVYMAKLIIMIISGKFVCPQASMLTHID